MFGRKKPEAPQSDSANADSDLPPLKLRSGAPAPSQPAVPSAPTTLVAPVQPKFDIPKRPADVSATAPTRPVTPAPTVAPPVSSSASANAPSEGKRLLVGRDIVLSGEITTCDQLVVEGRVEAALTDSRVIEIRETGYFKGTAEIDDAEIRGVFEGDLIVRHRLLIRATGKVTGEIRYGMLEIECGGQLSGDVQIIEAPPSQAMSHAGNGLAIDTADEGDLLSNEDSWQVPTRQ